MDKKEEEKKERMLAALDKGMVMIHLDARRPGVIVPQYLRTEAHLRLNLSYRFDPPDLSIGEWGLRSTLSFSGNRFTVAVPWSALFAITSYVTREFWIYPDDMPRELIEATMVPEKIEGLATESPTPISDGSTPPPPSPTGFPQKPSRSHLREIICEKSDEPAGNAPEAQPSAAPAAVRAEEDEGPQDEPPKPPQRGHLRIVK